MPTRFIVLGIIAGLVGITWMVAGFGVLAKAGKKQGSDAAPLQEPKQAA